MAAQKRDFHRSLGRSRKPGDGRVRFQFTYGGLVQIPPFPPSKSSSAAPTRTMGFPLRVGENGLEPSQIPSDPRDTAPKNAIFHPGRTGSTITAEQRATYHSSPGTGTDPTSQEVPRSPHRHTTHVPAPHAQVPFLQPPRLSSLTHATPCYQQESEAGVTPESLSTPQKVFSSFCNEQTWTRARATWTPVSSPSLGAAAVTSSSNEFLSPGKEEPSLAYHAVKRQYLDSSSGGGYIQLENNWKTSTLRTIADPVVARTGAVEVDDADHAVARQGKKRSRTSSSAFALSSPYGTGDSLSLQLPERFRVNEISPEGWEESNFHVDRTPSPNQPKSIAAEAAAVAAAFNAALHEVPRLGRMGEMNF